MKDRILEGKVIVISGGTKGVGRTMVEEYAREGAKVVFGGRDEQAAHQALHIVKTYGSEGLFVHTDLEKVSDCKKLFDEAFNKFGKIDGFFNYAGVTPVSPLNSCDEQTFDKVMDINFKAAFFCCQQAVNYMSYPNEYGDPRGGSIVLTGSPHAWGGEKDRAAYACSKGVLITLMEHIAKNYGENQVRCNYLALGWTPTDGEIALRIAQGSSEAELRKEAAKVIPMGRMNEKSDYVGTLIHLMSDDSAMISGSVIQATGGWWIGTSLQNRINSTVKE